MRGLIAQITHFLSVHGVLRALVLCWAGVFAWPAAGGDAPVPGPKSAPLQLRVVGGLAGVAQYTVHEAPFWTQTLPRLTQGRVTATIAPFDQAGVPGNKMLTLLETGVVPFGTVLLSQVTGENPALALPDMAGLSADAATLRRVVEAFEPEMDRLLRERFNTKMLAVYIYPAQVIFCTDTLRGLDDLKGRRVRVSSGSQADFVRALGGTPVPTAFSALMSNMASGNTDCAITGGASGNTLGLHQVTRSLFTMPINWGLAVFGANADAWAALPADVRDLLAHELEQLEQRIWAQSIRDTDAAVACNTGTGRCEGGTPGNMVAVYPSARDDQRRREILTASILPNWMQRCGPDCVRLWSRTIAPVISAGPVRTP